MFGGFGAIGVGGMPSAVGAGTIPAIVVIPVLGKGARAVAYKMFVRIAERIEAFLCVTTIENKGEEVFGWNRLQQFLGK
jgi:hypothetical protein